MLVLLSNYVFQLTEIYGKISKYDKFYTLVNHIVIIGNSENSAILKLI